MAGLGLLYEIGTSNLRYKIVRASNDLWKRLFKDIEMDLAPIQRIIIETDAFLDLFPFEALAPA